MEEKKMSGPHKLILEKRRSGIISGVNDVLSFDEKEILLQTEEGRLQIRGEQLHVRGLSLEKGEIELEGRVDSLVYMSKTKKEEPLLKRMFR